MNGRVGQLRRPGARARVFPLRAIRTIVDEALAALEREFAGLYSPIVRVPGPGDVQRILDAGALGIIAPHVQSADDARTYVRAAKYPPLGERSNAGSPAPSTVPLAAGRTGVCGDRRRHHGDRAVRERPSDRARRRDRRRRGVDMVLIGTDDLLADCLPGQTTTRGCARPMRRPLRPAAAMANTPRSAASPPGRTLRPNTCAWGPATSRPAPILGSCSRPAPLRPRK